MIRLFNISDRGELQCGLKRKAIIKHINSGKEFIPPCTVKAFTKFYTNSASKITSWQNADYNGYYEIMNNNFMEFMQYKGSEKNVDGNIAPDLLRKDERQCSIVQTCHNDNGSDEIPAKRFVDPIDFARFMDTYDVVIPKIQRLYVQGRADKHGYKCLSGFASALTNSVTTTSPLLLDFVYGIDTCENIKNIFYPLDGQQRLTTLLLLSWLCGKSKPEWSFKYESRRSTEMFVKGLLCSTPPKLLKPENYVELKKKSKEQGKDYPSLCKAYILNLNYS